MFIVTVDKEKTFMTAKGERVNVLAEALCCIDGCRDFLAKKMNISKEEANTMIAESLAE